MTPIFIIRNGEQAKSLMLEVRVDNTLWTPSGKNTKSPLVSRAACERLGLDPRKVLEAASPAEALLRLGENEGDVLVLTGSQYDAWRETNELGPTEKRNRFLGGLGDLEAAYHAWQSAESDYRDGFDRMMEDEHNDGARPPRRPAPELGERYLELKERYPRAALYLRAERQDVSAYWADNTGKGTAGRRAMQLVLEGRAEAEVETALAERREWVD